MSSTQNSSPQQLVVSTAQAGNSGKNRVMPTPSTSVAASQAASAAANLASNPAAAAAAAAALTMSVTPNSNQTNQDLASLFECPVCFDYVLPPILQVRIFKIFFLG